MNDVLDDEVKNELAAEDLNEGDFPVDSLVAYVLKHTRIKAHGKIDVHFFKVDLVNNPDIEEFKKFITAHVGDFNEVDVFDRKEHGYMELGGWIGDKGIALRFMALGSDLGMWQLSTPESAFGGVLPEAFLEEFAGAGFITIQVK